MWSSSKKYAISLLGPAYSVELANLAREIAEEETAGKESELLPFIPRTPCRQETNNVTGNRQRAGDAEMSDTSSKMPRSEADGKLQKLATSARQQRERVRKKIEELDQSSVSPFENSVPSPIPEGI